MIVVLIAGKPLAMPWVKENADAVLVQWYAGEQQGRTLADILLGKVNPSGKLNVSFPRSTGNTPCFYNHFVTDREEPFDQPGTPEEPKGHYIFDKPEPLWNFGHGKSYTTFDYVDCALSDTLLAASDTLKVSVMIKNTGRCDGKEVVQLYVRDKAVSYTHLDVYKRQCLLFFCIQRDIMNDRIQPSVWKHSFIRILLLIRIFLPA